MVVIAVTFENEEGIVSVEREYINSHDDIEDIIMGYAESGCKVLCWSYWQ